MNPYQRYVDWRKDREADGRRVNTAEAKVRFTHESMFTLRDWAARYESDRDEHDRDAVTRP